MHLTAHRSLPPPARPLVKTGYLLLLGLAAGCGVGPMGLSRDGGGGADLTPSIPVPDGGDITPDNGPDGAAPALPDLAGVDLLPVVPAVGGVARVTAGMLNLRVGPGTSHMIIAVMSCGDAVSIIGGPMNGWWNVTYQTYTGWASGTYLVADGAFNAALCGGGVTDGGGAAHDGGGGPVPMSIDVAGILGRAKLGVGYSYYWGHGAWRSDGAQLGTCVGSCGSCSHTGLYGADCSGFVAKCWQIPAPSPIETDLHPYATYNFYNETTHWSVLPRSKIQAVDALTYNSNGHGHIMLFESGTDPWGSIWTYEARGCATGIQHNLRVADSSYITIRREGL